MQGRETYGFPRTPIPLPPAKRTKYLCVNMFVFVFVFYFAGGKREGVVGETVGFPTKIDYFLHIFFGGIIVV
jgi:hypothetical protein